MSGIGPGEHGRPRGSSLESAPAGAKEDETLRLAAIQALGPDAGNLRARVEGVALNALVEETLGLFRAANKYLEVTAPWKLAKGGEPELRRMRGVLWHAGEALRIGFTLLHPVMPAKMTAALEALGIAPRHSPLAWREGNAGLVLLPAVTPLFPRVIPGRASGPPGSA
jgi:methionyl-tRNA synthetase